MSLNSSLKDVIKNSRENFTNQLNMNSSTVNMMKVLWENSDLKFGLIRRKNLASWMLIGILNTSI